MKDSYFSNKKTAVQFVLSLFVFFIHFCLFSVFDSKGALVTGIFNVLLPLTHVAVPLFYVISAALFYRDYTLASTLKKWKSRFFSLCIPYLVWNSIWLLLALLGYYTPLGLFLGNIRTAFSWEAVLRGIFLHGFFVPFWFILQLIVFTALCPVIYLFLKNKWVGLGTICLASVAHALGFPAESTVLPNPVMLIFYLWGAWIGLHAFPVFTRRWGKPQAAVCLVLYLLCCLYIGVADLLPVFCISRQMMLLVKIISCGAFWVAFDLLDISRCPACWKETFLIYAMHSLVGGAIAKILDLLLPDGDLFRILIGVITFAATLVIICIFGKLLGLWFPRLKKLLTGR